MTCKDSTGQIGPIKFTANGREITELATDEEIAHMRSVIVSLGWIERQGRPNLSYNVSKGQGVVNEATIKNLKEVDQAVESPCTQRDKYPIGK